MFLESAFPICRESIALAIRSARPSTGCCFITSIASCQNTRYVSRRSTGFAVLRREANEGGYFRPIIKEFVERYFDCGNPRSGFALMIRRRPVLSLKRLLFLEREGKVGYRHGPDGAELERMDYLELIARVTSHIPDKGQVMVRYYGLYANAHRGKVRKADRVAVALGMIEPELLPTPAKGWAALAPKRRIGLRSAEMIRKVYEVDPLVCPRCGGRMKVVAFLTEYAVVDRIIRHLELTFAAEKPPPVHIFEQVALMAPSWKP